jgi:F-type H+-transporting ATPase subunit delta
MKNQRVARRYAVALMEVTEEVKAVDSAALDLAMVGATIRGSRELQLLLASPVIPTVRKKRALKEIFGTRVGVLTMQILELLTTKGREGILPEVIEEFALLRDERAGVVTAEVTSAVDATKEQEEALRRRLEGSTGKTVRLRWRKDPAIRGGLVVRVGDTVLDASIRRQLERLRERLLFGDAAGTHA